MNDPIRTIRTSTRRASRLAHTSDAGLAQRVDRLKSRLQPYSPESDLLDEIAYRLTRRNRHVPLS